MAWKLLYWRTNYKIEVDKDGVEHHSHTHDFSFAASHSNHRHGGYPDYSHSTDVKCDSGGVMNAHDHNVSTSWNAGAAHTISGTTGSTSALDVNHTHTIDVTSSSTGAHTHTPTGSGNDGCNYVNCSPEDEHNHDGSGTYSSGGSHSHQLTGTTGTGTGTITSHTHSVDLATNTGNSYHAHGAGSAVLAANTRCHLSNNHGHSCETSRSTNSHTHTISDDTDLGGETVVAPTVTTQAVTAIAVTTATGNGNITATGYEDASAWGVCYNVGGNPTTADDTAAGTGSGGVGAFTAAMTGLTGNQKYYVKAYATNTEGTGYGAQVDFTTKQNYSKPSSVIIGLLVAASGEQLTKHVRHAAVIIGVKASATRTWAVNIAASVIVGLVAKAAKKTGILRHIVGFTNLRDWRHHID